MIFVEILSRVRFVLNMKTSSLLLVLGMVAAGAGLLARSYMIGSQESKSEPERPSDSDDQKKS